MERSSRVLQHGNPEMWKNFKKFEIEFCPYPEFPYAEKKIALASSISVLHKKLIRQRKGLHEYYSMGTKKFDFFLQKFEIEFDLYFDLCWRA